MKVQVRTNGASAPEAVVPTPEEFYREWFPKVVTMARYCADPEDVAQEVILGFLKAGYIDRWDASKGRSLKSYCATMLRYRVTSAYRKQRRRQDHETLAGDSLSLGGDSETDRHVAMAPSHDDVDWVEELIDWRRLATALDNTTLHCMVDMVEAGIPVYDRTVGERIGRSETAVRARRKALRETLRPLLSGAVRLTAHEHSALACYVLEHLQL